MKIINGLAFSNGGGLSVYGGFSNVFHSDGKVRIFPRVLRAAAFASAPPPSPPGSAPRNCHSKPFPLAFSARFVIEYLSILAAGSLQ